MPHNRKAPAHPVGFVFCGQPVIIGVPSGIQISLAAKGVDEPVAGSKYGTIFRGRTIAARRPVCK